MGLINLFTKYSGKWRKIQSGDYPEFYTPDACYHRSSSAYHLGMTTITALSTVAIAKDTMRWTPIIIPKRVTVTKMAINVTIAGDAGTVARLGIFAAVSGSCLPGTLILDAGTVSIAGTGAVELTISQVLDPGLYWLGINHNSTTSPTLRSCISTAFPPVLGSVSTLPTAILQVVTKVLTYAAFVNATGTSSSNTAAQLPAIYLVYS